MAVIRPHDLLWGMTPAHLASDAPAWVACALADGQPVVVRRGRGGPGLVAVGVRGVSRDQRHAGCMP
ncbi:MAG: phosphoribosyl-dephospho-CoA transferase, partial [Pseudomonas sp.]